MFIKNWKRRKKSIDSNNNDSYQIVKKSVRIRDS